MPNPRDRRPRTSDRPLDEAVGFATHIVIKCAGIASRTCGHRTIMMTAELYAKLPRCKTVRQFSDKLVCKRCGLKGWCTIEAAGRG